MAKASRKVATGKSEKQPAAEPATELAYIHESLRGLAVPLGDLQFDPANGRAHDARNIAAIRGSLSQFGQRRPAVVQRQGMIVRAGNGMLQAAQELGWTHLAAIVVDEDNVSAISYAIADNRTSELATWDEKALEELLRTVEVGDPELQQMFTDLAEDMDFLDLDEEDPDETAAGETPPVERPKQWQVIVKCKTDLIHRELIDELSKRGLECVGLCT